MTNLVEVLLLCNIEELGEETHHCFSALTTVPGDGHIVVDGGGDGWRPMMMDDDHDHDDDNHDSDEGLMKIIATW